MAGDCEAAPNHQRRLTAKNLFNFNFKGLFQKKNFCDSGQAEQYFKRLNFV